MSGRLWENLASLYGVHAFNYLVPLFTLPYLTRVLGAGEWGAFAFADAYGRVVALAVEYGFGLSATREIARVRHDPDARGRELSGVLGAQMLLAALALLITVFLARTVAVFDAHRRLLPGALFLAISQGASPMWYFQGIERVRLVGSLWIAGRIAGAIGLFVFVRTPGDGPAALFIQGTAPFLSVAAGLAIAYRDTRFLWPSLAAGSRALRAGGSIFLFRTGVSFYTSINVVLLALVAPPVMVAWFAGAEKIARAAVAATGPITQVFYPRISRLLASDRRAAAQTVRLSTALMMGVGASAFVILFAGAPVLVKLLLGPGFEGSVIVLRVLALLPPLVALSNVFGVQWMLALGLDRELNRIILAATVLDVALAMMFGRSYQHRGVALSVVCAEIFVVAAILRALWSRSLNPWRQPLEQRRAVA